jgi:hypothetical protein
MGQLPCATLIVIQSLEPVGKSWMGEFQLPSAKTHIMLQPTAGVGRTKNERKIEVSMPTLPAQAIYSQRHIDVRFGSITSFRARVRTSALPPLATKPSSTATDAAGQTCRLVRDILRSLRGPIPLPKIWTRIHRPATRSSSGVPQRPIFVRRVISALTR